MINYAKKLMNNSRLLLKCDKHGGYSKDSQDPDQECPKCKKGQKRSRFVGRKINPVINKLAGWEIYEDRSSAEKGLNHIFLIKYITVSPIGKVRVIAMYWGKRAFRVSGKARKVKTEDEIRKLILSASDIRFELCG